MSDQPYQVTPGQQVAAGVPQAIGNTLAGFAQPLAGGYQAVDDALNGNPVDQGTQMDRMAGLGALMAAPAGTGGTAARTGAVDLQDAFAAMMAGHDGPSLEDMINTAISQQGKQAAASHAERVVDTNPNGLPLDKASRMARAQDMGFDTQNPLYHGTASTFDAFHDPSSLDRERAIFLAPDPQVAAFYASNRMGSGNGHVLPVLARTKNPMTVDYSVGRPDTLSNLIETARDVGHDSLVVHNYSDGYGDVGDARPQTQVMVFDPSHVRSTSAVFDPAAAGSSDLLRTGGGAPVSQDTVEAVPPGVPQLAHGGGVSHALAIAHAALKGARITILAAPRKVAAAAIAAADRMGGVPTAAAPTAAPIAARGVAVP